MASQRHSKIRHTALADVAHELSSLVDWETRIINVLVLLCDAIPSQTAALGVEFPGWRTFYSHKPEDTSKLEEVLIEHYATLTGGPARKPGRRAIESVEDTASSFLSMPVIGADRVLGVLHVRVDEPRTYSRDDITACSVAALQIGSFLTSVRAQTALAAAHEDAELRAAQTESMVGNLAEGVTLLDAEGRVVYMNDAGKALLGLPADIGPVDWWAFERRSPDGIPMSRQDMPSYKALQGHTTKDQRYQLVTADGRTVSMSISASPVRDSIGNVVGVANVFRDQTERVDLEARREELLQREHRIAETLQQALVPPDVPEEILGCRIAVKYEPALREAEVGGDFYDVFELGDGKIGILIGDVAGKGLPAAIRVAAARYSIRSYAFLDPDPARVMTLANAALCKEGMDEKNILTAFFIVLDTRNGILTYTSAGHEPALICDSEGHIHELGLGALPLGAMDGICFPRGSHTLAQDDSVILVTDGITEARDHHSVLFDKKGVVEYVADRCGESPDEIASGLLRAAREHAGGQLQDDAAIVTVRVGVGDPAVTGRD